jgi:hypothetical protein
MIQKTILAAAAALLPVLATAATISQTDPQEGGIGYKFTIGMERSDEAIFSSHVGAWSWEDDSLFDAETGEPPVGWTHTSNWVALTVAARVRLTVRIERDATVPWPSQSDPDRLAATASMFPSFTIFRGWDNDPVPPEFAARPEVIAAWADFGGVPPDLGDWHTYNNRGYVEWAEDLRYIAHVDNSTLETIEHTFILEPGQYSIAIGSNAPATDPLRQGYRATFATEPAPAPDTYFIPDAIQPLQIGAATGILANDAGLAAPADTIEIVSQPALGVVALDPDGAFTYTPGPFFGVAGRDAFTYRVLLDGDPASATAAATVAIRLQRSAAGAYAGVLRNEATGAPEGFIRLQLSPRGASSGFLLHGGKKFPIRGSIGSDGDFAIARPATGLAIQLLTRDDGTRCAEITFTGADFTLHGEAFPSPFSPLAPAPFAGAHSLLLEVAAATEGAPETPGRARLRIARNGTATLAGRLGDRTPFACATALVQTDRPGPIIPVFTAIYRGKTGSISGKLEFGSTATSAPAGTLTAVKPELGTPPAPGFTIDYTATPSTP